MLCTPSVYLPLSYTTVYRVIYAFKSIWLSVCLFVYLTVSCTHCCMYFVVIWQAVYTICLPVLLTFSYPVCYLCVIICWVECLLSVSLTHFHTLSHSYVAVVAHTLSYDVMCPQSVCLSLSISYTQALYLDIRWHTVCIMFPAGRHWRAAVHWTPDRLCVPVHSCQLTQPAPDHCLLTDGQCGSNTSVHQCSLLLWRSKCRIGEYMSVSSLLLFHLLFLSLRSDFCYSLSSFILLWGWRWLSQSLMIGLEYGHLTFLFSDSMLSSFLDIIIAMC